MGSSCGRVVACVVAVLVWSVGSGCAEARKAESQEADPRRVEQERAEPDPSTASATGEDENPSYAAGDAVWVTWTGSSYQARILEVRDGEYKIRYDGYDSSWDEWVPPSRIRGRIDAAATPVGVRTATGASAGSHVATWECATFDAGQINRIGGFTLRADGGYTDLNSGASGRYTIAQNSIRFTSGPQRTDAPVRYAPEARSGQGMIVFDYGDGARLDCYRARTRS